MVEPTSQKQEKVKDEAGADDTKGEAKLLLDEVTGEMVSKT
jgi:hypothetical protein